MNKLYRLLRNTKIIKSFAFYNDGIYVFLNHKAFEKELIYKCVNYKGEIVEDSRTLTANEVGKVLSGGYSDYEVKLRDFNWSFDTKTYYFLKSEKVENRMIFYNDEDLYKLIKAKILNIYDGLEKQIKHFIDDKNEAFNYALKCFKEKEIEKNFQKEKDILKNKIQKEKDKIKLTKKKSINETEIKKEIQKRIEDFKDKDDVEIIYRIGK